VSMLTCHVAEQGARASTWRQTTWGQVPKLPLNFATLNLVSSLLYV
jgi:hypothetical protein